MKDRIKNFSETSQVVEPARRVGTYILRFQPSLAGAAVTTGSAGACPPSSAAMPIPPSSSFPSQLRRPPPWLGKTRACQLGHDSPGRLSESVLQDYYYFGLGLFKPRLGHLLSFNKIDLKFDFMLNELGLNLLIWLDSNTV